MNEKCYHRLDIFSTLSFNFQTVSLLRTLLDFTQGYKSDKVARFLGAIPLFRISERDFLDT